MVLGPEIGRVGQGAFLGALSPLAGELSGQLKQLTSADCMQERRSRSRLGRRGDPDDPFGGKPANGPDALARGLNTTGQRMPNMLAACSDAEVKSMAMLLQKLGVLSSSPMPDNAQAQAGAEAGKEAGDKPQSGLPQAPGAGQYMQGHDPLPALGHLPESALEDRAALDQLLHKLGSLVEPSTESKSQRSSTPAPQAKQGASNGGAAAGGASPAAGANGSAATGAEAAADGSTGDGAVTGASKSPGPAGTGSTTPNGLPRYRYRGDLTAQADFMHPFTELLLARPPTLYVLDPNAQGGIDEPDPEPDAVPGSTGAGGGAASTAKTPGPGPGRPKGKTGPKPKTPGLLATPAPAAGAASAQPTPHQGELASTAGATVAEDGAAAAGGEGGGVPATPAAGEAAGGEEGAAALQAAGQEGESWASGRAKRAASQSSLFSAAKAAMPPTTGKGKRGPKPKAGVAAGAGAAGGVAGVAGTQAKGGAPTPGGLTLHHHSKGPAGTLRQDLSDLPVAAAVAALCSAGPAEGSLQEQWPALEASADLLCAAPDDEILAEILALQSELVQQVGVSCVPAHVGGRGGGGG